MSVLWIGYEDATAHNTEYTGYFVLKGGERINCNSLQELENIVKQHGHWEVEVSHKGWGHTLLMDIADQRKNDLQYADYLDWLTDGEN